MSTVQLKPLPKSSPIFVYGTMMSPKLLTWVLTGDPANYLRLHEYVKLQPARLHGYRRVPVKGSDYPALIPAESSSAVDGVLVFRDTLGGWGKLDDFAGDIYLRTGVQCHYIDQATEGEEAKAAKYGEAMEDGWEVVARDGAVAADTYVWDGDRENLELDKDWSFEEFEKKKLQYWLDAFKSLKGRD